jgi:hypothetical protein
MCARSAQRKNSAVSLKKKTRITEDSESSARRALSKCIRVHKEPRTTERSVEKILRQEGVEKVCRAGTQREENSLSSEVEGRVH